MPRIRPRLSILLACLAVPLSLRAAGKPPLTLDEFFNSVEIRAVRLAPDGQAVVIETARADWQRDRFRNDLWLYRQGSGLVQLTQSGHDSDPSWSPDGRWIAFLSDRAEPAPEPAEPTGDEKQEPTAQVWAIPVAGGEAFPVTHGKEEAHAFAWSADSHLIYFSTRTPWSHEQEETYKKEWKDVIQFREAERGDTLFSIDVAAVAGRLASGQTERAAAPAPQKIASTPYRVSEIQASSDGHALAFATVSRSRREESREPYAINLVELPGDNARELLKLQAEAHSIRWSPDSRHVLFRYENGNPAGPYEDPQSRLYWASAGHAPGAKADSYERWSAKFDGAITDYAVLPSGGLVVAGRNGTEVQPYTELDPATDLSRQPGWPGTYENISAAAHSPRVAFVYSSLEQPGEVYLAESADQMNHARPITAFNRLFTERALPEGRPYRWKADDGVSVEGMLIFPPGHFGARHLPMFTLIHGGPEDADGNYFEADWYQWAALAATHGWVVFEPNYRGSVGYGDAFALGIIPHIVSRPGQDILEGIDQLVRDSIADPDHLTVGGYSYGGYMTNWLITETQRFKAAVSGAGAVEHVANWGNDDTTFDDAYFLGGVPWETEKNYNAEAAIWRFAQVTTPTHVVAGSEDIRVYVGEDYLLERALETRGIPTSLLVFPGEGHSLDKNPWHGKIKVREELKWLDKYGRP